MAQNYPLPVFHFKVEVDGLGDGTSFAEVSGLTVETEPIEYRDGDSNDMTPVKMPGLKKYSNITLKRGIIHESAAFFDWLNTIALNTVERHSMTISLLDEGHNPVMVWTVREAWPVKVEGPGLKSTGNEVAIESIEIAHEGLTVGLG